MGAAMLTSDLLLPKGAATPSCMDDRPLPANGARLTVATAGLDDGGGSGAGAYGASARRDKAATWTRSPQGQALAESGSSCAHANVVRAGEHRARLSVRLDPQRHLRLRLLAAHKQAHIQDILVEALDDYVAREAPSLGLETCQCLTSEVTDETSLDDQDEISRAEERQ